MAPTVYFVSGANRGIGLGLVKAISSRPDTVVFATARNPSQAEELNALAKESNGTVHVIKLAARSEEDAKAAAQVIEEKAGKLDVLIANAGVAQYFGPAHTTPITEFQTHFEVNTLGPVVLFQSLAPLLFKSSHPQFVAISSSAGKIKDPIHFPVTAYGTSKAALNFFTAKLHTDYAKENLTSFSVHPGFVQTDMGNPAAKSMGLESAPVTVVESALGILALSDGATRESRGGRFWGWTGEEYPW